MFGKLRYNCLTYAFVPALRLQGITKRFRCRVHSSADNALSLLPLQPLLQYINHIWSGFLCKLNSALYKRTEPHAHFFCFRPKCCAEIKGKEISCATGLKSLFVNFNVFGFKFVSLCFCLASTVIVIITGIRWRNCLLLRRRPQGNRKRN
jgi:hypothetical protein